MRLPFAPPRVLRELFASTFLSSEFRKIGCPDEPVAPLGVLIPRLFAARPVDL